MIVQSLFAGRSQMLRGEVTYLCGSGHDVTATDEVTQATKKKQSYGIFLVTPSKTPSEHRERSTDAMATIESFSVTTNEDSHNSSLYFLLAFSLRYIAIY